jgi:hypothetical protein
VIELTDKSRGKLTTSEETDRVLEPVYYLNYDNTKLERKKENNNI